MGMREDLNAALDSTQADDDTQNFEETRQEVLGDEEAGTTGGDTGASDDGTTSTDADAGGDGSPTSTDTPAADANENPVEPNDDQAAEGKKPAASSEASAEPASNDSIKAPIDWSPKEREAWSKIPRNLQEKVMAREKQMGEMMQSTSEARKTHEAFGKLTQQYGAVLSGIEGNNPIEQAGNLFNTVANLRMGSPIQKAQIIADMINDFGVDINTLDSAIVGQAPPAEQQESDRIDQLVAERMKPFEAMMGQQNAYKEQQATQVQEAANTEIKAFADNAEFINDVRHDMADFLEMADKRGQQMTVQEAYDKACMLKPEIQTVLNERKQRAALTASNNTIASKKNAASSVNGRQVGGGGGSSAASMRDTIANAWDNQDKL